MSLLINLLIILNFMEKQNLFKLFEGSYEYFQDNKKYSQESFEVFRNDHTGDYVFQSEVLSRVKSGEFLKVQVNYIMNFKLRPLKVTITRHLGRLFAIEDFDLDPNNHTMTYTFTDNKEVFEQITKPVAQRCTIATPAFLTATLFTNSGKFSALGRTPMPLIVSDNEWEYKGPPQEKSVYAEFVNSESDNLVINNQKLKSTKCQVYQHDTSESIQEDPAVFHVSKYMGMPYFMIAGDLKVSIKNLKKIHDPFGD